MSRYASLYAEQCHADLVLARDVIQRAARELAEILEGNPNDRPDAERWFLLAFAEIVTDQVSPEVWNAASQYDDANPLRVAA